MPSNYYTGHPMSDVLNYELGFYSWYIPQALPYTPSPSDVSMYTGDLVSDIYGGQPVVGDAWEVPYQPHLVGHPIAQEIFHWFMIYGYHGYGAQTSYEDSATSVWRTVPAWVDSFDTATMVTILGGRGYLW